MIILKIIGSNDIIWHLTNYSEQKHTEMLLLMN